jgi:hypothetical protein
VQPLSRAIFRTCIILLAFILKVPLNAYIEDSDDNRDGRRLRSVVYVIGRMSVHTIGRVAPQSDGSMAL